ncbi:MAG TPA: 16S rRNA processing protein RimM, partial [Clostridiales bacterium]|nr:16S rRNA processing protein RimM [Clostridiales bacterium]
NRNDLPKLPDGKYYIVDMIGLDIVVAGEVIGEVCDVLQYGSADVYVVKNGQESLSFPAIGNLIKQVDLENGKMVLDDMIFPRVVVYN